VLLDEQAKKYTNNFYYYILPNNLCHYIDIYIKTNIYSLYKIIYKYTFYINRETGSYITRNKYFYDLYVKNNEIFTYISYNYRNIIKYKMKNSLLFLIYKKYIYEINTYIYYCQNNNKYMPNIQKYDNLNGLILKKSYNVGKKFMNPFSIHFSLKYHYNYIDNYIYGTRDNVPIDNICKFISNWRICILFI